MWFRRKTKIFYINDQFEFYEYISKKLDQIKKMICVILMIIFYMNIKKIMKISKIYLIIYEIILKWKKMNIEEKINRLDYNDNFISTFI